MKCKSCKREIDADAIFCKWCGTKQIKERGEVKVPTPRKLASGSYSAQLMVDGKRVTITGDTEKDYYAKARAAKTGLMEIKKAPPSITLNDAIDKYILCRENSLSPLTIRSYRIYQKNRFKSTMTRPLSKIAPSEWQGIVNAEAALCAPKTLKNAWGCIRSVVKDATGEYPPAVTLPPPVKGEPRFLSPAQIKVFVEAVKDTPYATPALLALSSLRVSEIAALRWENIPPHAELIRVSGAAVLDEHNNVVVKAQNKNATSARNVPIMIPELSASLERDRQPSGFVMAISQNSLRRGIEKICRENGLPNVGIHGLRHSFASLAYHLQIPEKIAAEIGGWKDETTMHKIYTHVASEDVAHYRTEMSDFYREKPSPELSHTG